MNFFQIKGGKSYKINLKELGFMYVQCLKGSNFKAFIKDEVECQFLNKF